MYDCNTCPTRCDGKSKGLYLFEKDLDFSEHFEQEIVNHLNKKNNLFAKKTSENSYPDIEVHKKDVDDVWFYIEIKVQKRTFMSVEKILPYSNLKPSETVALNLSDLLRYFSINEKTQKPVFIFWGVLNRPCIIKQNEYLFFYQNIKELKKIYERFGDKRRFRRKSGKGDVVNGVHKGVTVNYHFSLNELKKFSFK
ncbi:MAG: hypothetical protein DRJ01_15885 [Bacteroidetes bacterium]|nr:MAG: hypothetical protein DRJ01_15885 [Bacteroidota bacterium]